MLGRVPVRVSLEGGAIAIGDRLTASSIPGVAMKATSTARTVGFALEHYSSETASETIMLHIQPELTFADIELATESEITTFATLAPDVPLSSWMSDLMDSLLARVTDWLASAANGIGDLFANRVRTKELCVEKSDGSEVRVTGDQLAAKLEGEVAQSGASNEADQDDDNSNDNVSNPNLGAENGQSEPPPVVPEAEPDTLPETADPPVADAEQGDGAETPPEPDDAQPEMAGAPVVEEPESDLGISDENLEAQPGE